MSCWHLGHGQRIGLPIPHCLLEFLEAENQCFSISLNALTSLFFKWLHCIPYTLWSFDSILPYVQLFDLQEEALCSLDIRRHLWILHLGQWPDLHHRQLRESSSTLQTTSLFPTLLYQVPLSVHAVNLAQHPSPESIILAEECLVEVDLQFSNLSTLQKLN